MRAVAVVHAWCCALREKKEDEEEEEEVEDGEEIALEEGSENEASDRAITSDGEEKK